MCWRLVFAVAVLGGVGNTALAAEPARQGNTAWGEPVDGIACRVVMGADFVIGQPMPAVFELKNVSDKKRYLFLPRKNIGLSYDDIYFNGCFGLGLVGPKNAKAAPVAFRTGLPANFPIEAIQAVAPGEVVHLGQVADVRGFFTRQLHPWLWGGQEGSVAMGKYTLSCAFRAPAVPARFVASRKFVEGKEVAEYKDAPKEMLAGAWARQVVSNDSAFELKPLAADDLVVHEWGVFTVFNDVKYANLNRKAEWSSLPDCFYRQFPKPRLQWQSSGWDKPIVYFYAKPESLHLKVKVTFAAGAPVAWWPCAADPVDHGWPGGDARISAREAPAAGPPFRSLTWQPWLGERVPTGPSGPFVQPAGAVTKPVTEFPLPADCWVRQARIPSASHLTVDGTDTDPKAVYDYWRRTMGGTLLRPETERFIYYDGLVPTPEYLRCEKIEAGAITLRNRAPFEMGRLFVVDRRGNETVGLASVDAKAFKSGTTLKVEPKPIAVKDWPAEGIKQVRHALLDSGLFGPEADALLAIQRKVMLEADGVTAFHILPQSEYDRMLPLSIGPAPARKPVRVGIALHPHLEIEPELTERVTTLIRQLDDATFAKRDAASKMLQEIGPMAIALLRAELKKNPPLEVRRRIEAILSSVDAEEWLNPPAKNK